MTQINRRQFLQVVGAIGTVSALAVIPSPTTAAELEAMKVGNVVFKALPKGAEVWIGTDSGTTIWSGKTTGGRLFVKLPLKFNGQETSIRIRKRGYQHVYLSGSRIPADGSVITHSVWMQRDAFA